MMVKKQLYRNLCLTCVLLLGSAACDMDITNLNQPDRDRALAEPQALESLVGGTFNVYFNELHSRATMAILMPGYGSEMTGAAFSGGGVTQGMEPRGPFENAVNV